VDPSNTLRVYVDVNAVPATSLPLPVVVMLAFVSEPLYTFALVLSWFGIGVLILYRYILSYAAVRNQVKLNPFQFLLYLLAFEFAPLLLIYKLLILYFN
jgi:hypothetical protein